jgi:sugar phosphate isomerase/epimerase
MIYASTSCLKNPSNVIRVLEEYEKEGIDNVELGSVHSNFDISKLKKFNFNFIIHNYFPPPKNPFNFNLASQNVSIRNKSINLAKKAIDLCQKINSPIYTFHAGFTVDPENLGSKFSRKNIVKRETAISTYIESLGDIIEHSKKNSVKIAMEPNVVQKFNLINNKNELSLFADIPELKYLYKFINKKDLGLLLDLGHTNVTSTWLNFNRDEFVDFCKNKTLAVHISNNDGKKDQHKALTKDCWHLSKLKLFKNKPIILETMNLTTKQISNNINIAKSALV